MQFSNRVLAWVLPPAGQILEKLHLYSFVDTSLGLFVTAKHGVTTGAASGGSDF